MKCLRVVRFDHSDDHVFAEAAASGEWAVSGAFAFADDDEEALTGKRRQAFANGFLGVPSFGRSTFATVSEMDREEHDRLVDRLAQHFVDAYSAPDLEAARPAALEEIGFVSDMCAEKSVNTVFTVRRVIAEEGIREEFREIAAPKTPDHARIWDVVEDEA